MSSEILHDREAQLLAMVAYSPSVLSEGQLEPVGRNTREEERSFSGQDRVSLVHDLRCHLGLILCPLLPCLPWTLSLGYSLGFRSAYGLLRP